jgi:UDP-2,3-diacylglucosamine hydrolase
MIRRLTLIAGSGALPPLVCASALRAGAAVQIIDLIGRGDLNGEAVLHVPVSQAQAISEAILDFRSTHLVAAGGVMISDGDRKAIASALGLPGQLARPLGDIALALAFLAHFRLAGVRVIGAHEVVADLLAPDGQFAGPPTTSALMAYGYRGLSAARAIGRLDLGQAIVMSGSRPVAAEDAEGTDALLSRVARLREAGRIGDGTAPLILAKAMKPRQPKFLDLPTIGPETITKAAAAGIAAIVVEAQRCLVLDRSEVSERASSLGISVLGLRARRA